MIWSSRFLESVHTEQVGGKGGGGASVREYSYSVSLAIALCEGEVSRVGRIWADGQAVEQNGLTFRLHRGTEGQLPDPLIEAIEGAAPAYRGTAYVVIEHLDLTPFGNRIPQFNFEVFRRPPASLPGVPRSPALDVRGVALVPGCGEYALATEQVHFKRGKGDNVVLNVHNDRGVPDLVASLDQLTAELPNTKSVSLVVSWFGDDLRCDRCSLRPAVEQAGEDGRPMRWEVSGQGRGSAHVVSRTPDNRPIFGGTPADASVLQAIARLKASGLKVMFYPFILMDIQAGNGRSDPWTGAADQPPVPWRGRITLAKAPGRSGSSDKTTAAAGEVAAFFGRAAPGDFQADGDTVAYEGPEEWSYRRFVLHYAHLCALAGGVDAFCIGSEMRSLTQIRDSAAGYPAVRELCTLAEEVRGILGAGHEARICRGLVGIFRTSAGGRIGRPALPSRSALGLVLDRFRRHRQLHAAFGLARRNRARGRRGRVDLRPRLSQGQRRRWRGVRLVLCRWRGPGGAGAPSDHRWRLWRGLGVSLQGPGELVVEAARRAAGRRQGGRAHGLAAPLEADLVHRARLPGGEQGHQPAERVPRPQVFRELLSVLLGRMPGRFHPVPLPPGDPRHWNDPANNPSSGTYGGRMVDMDRAHVWAWDARPWPDFPNRLETWIDGGNYETGHWLNGRASLASLAEVVAEICQRSGLDAMDLARLHGGVAGYTIDAVETGRQSLQPLMLAYAFDSFTVDGALAFANRGNSAAIEISPDALVAAGREPVVSLTRTPAAETPERVTVGFVRAEQDYLPGAVEALAPDAVEQRTEQTSLPLVLFEGEAEAIAGRALSEGRIARDGLACALPPSMLALTPGDLLALPSGTEEALYRVDRIEEAGHRAVSAVRIEASVYEAPVRVVRASRAPVLAAQSPVDAEFLDLPLLSGDEDPLSPRVAVARVPWAGPVAVFAADNDYGYAFDREVRRPAVMGSLIDPLPAGMPGLWMRAAVRVGLVAGALQSRSESDVLNGANAAALRFGSSGDWEVLQFRERGAGGAAAVSSGRPLCAGRREPTR